MVGLYDAGTILPLVVPRRRSGCKDETLPHLMFYIRTGRVDWAFNDIFFHFPKPRAPSSANVAESYYLPQAHYARDRYPVL